MASAALEDYVSQIPEHENGTMDPPHALDHSATADADADAPLPPTGPSGGVEDQDEFIQDRKIYIGGLPKHTEQRDLQDCFSDFGRVLSVQLKQGFGFVEFDNQESAQKAIDKFNKGLFLGVQIQVQLSRSKQRRREFVDNSTCFRCHEQGHFIRDCPLPPPPPDDRRPALHDRRPYNDDRSFDRIERGDRNRNFDRPPRDYSYYRGGNGRDVASKSYRNPSPEPYRAAPSDPYPRSGSNGNGVGGRPPYDDYPPPPPYSRYEDYYRRPAYPPPSAPPPRRSFDYHPEPYTSGPDDRYARGRPPPLSASSSGYRRRSVSPQARRPPPPGPPAPSNNVGGYRGHPNREVPSRYDRGSGDFSSERREYQRSGGASYVSRR